MVKLHASLRDQTRQLQRVAVIAAELEDALTAERKDHHDTQEKLQRMGCRLEEVARETMDLRYRTRISDYVLQALRETREVDVSDLTMGLLYFFCDEYTPYASFCPWSNRLKLSSSHDDECISPYGYST